jgi:hypothetical protein
MTLDFEGEMIRMIDPEIAGIDSVYGYRFSSGEPFKSYFPVIFLRNFFPWEMVTALSETLASRQTGRWVKMQNDHRYFYSLAETVRSYDLPIDISKLIERTDLGPLIFAMGYLFSRFSNKIN